MSGDRGKSRGTAFVARVWLRGRMRSVANELSESAMAERWAPRRETNLVNSLIAGRNVLSTSSRSIMSLAWMSSRIKFRVRSVTAIDSWVEAASSRAVRVRLTTTAMSARRMGALKPDKIIRDHTWVCSSSPVESINSETINPRSAPAVMRTTKTRSRVRRVCEVRSLPAMNNRAPSTETDKSATPLETMNDGLTNRPSSDADVGKNVMPKKAKIVTG